MTKKKTLLSLLLVLALFFAVLALGSKRKDLVAAGFFSWKTTSKETQEPLEEEPMTLDVVAAIYQHPVDEWLPKALENLPDHVTRCRVFAYTKGSYQPNPSSFESLPRCELYVKPLENVGRCDHTYLHHIAEHYDDLSPLTLFLKDTAFSQGWYNSICFFTKSVSSQIKGWCSFFATLSLHGWKLDNYSSNSRPYSESDEDFMQAEVRPIEHWASIFTRITDLGDKSPVQYGGIMAASRESIQTQSQQIYKSLEQVLTRGNNIEDGHFMERLWLLLFGYLPSDFEPEFVLSEKTRSSKQPLPYRQLLYQSYYTRDGRQFLGN